MPPTDDRVAPAPPLRTIAREWGRIGCVGFGGPPAHVALLRDTCVVRHRWIGAADFEDAIATTNLLPGPGSTQLAIYCAWRLRGPRGALVGGAGFVLPGLVLIVLLAALFLSGAPPAWVRGAGAGAGAVVAAVAWQAGTALLSPGWRRTTGVARRRWVGHVAVGVLGAATVGAWLVVLLLACGALELVVRAPGGSRRGGAGRPGRLRVDAWPALPVVLGAVAAGGGLGSLAWVALKVGALSYGGGFVIVPLMQADAVGHFGWMTGTEFASAVALGQVTPGPVVHTVAVVGYAAAGVGGALLAAAVAFAPSFSFVLLGGRRFDRLRADARVRAFLDGAGPAAIGAIVGSAVPLAAALEEPWQVVLLGAAVVALVFARRGVVPTLLTAGVLGAVVGIAGGPLPG